MITLWNTISTSNYNGTSITLEIRIGTLRKCKMFEVNLLYNISKI